MKKAVKSSAVQTKLTAKMNRVNVLLEEICELFEKLDVEQKVQTKSKAKVKKKKKSKTKKAKKVKKVKK